MKLFKTRHQGCAAALRYALGSDAHLQTYREANGIPFGVSDAKTLIDEFIAVRRTMTTAIDSPSGLWRNGANDE